MGDFETNLKAIITKIIENENKNKNISSVTPVIPVTPTPSTTSTASTSTSTSTIPIPIPSTASTTAQPTTSIASTSTIPTIPFSPLPTIPSTTPSTIPVTSPVTTKSTVTLPPTPVIPPQPISNGMQSQSLINNASIVFSKAKEQLVNAKELSSYLTSSLNNNTAVINLKSFLLDLSKQINSNDKTVKITTGFLPSLTNSTQKIMNPFIKINSNKGYFTKNVDEMFATLLVGNEIPKKNSYFYTTEYVIPNNKKTNKNTKTDTKLYTKTKK